MPESVPVVPEFSRPLALDSLGDQEVETSISATPEERRRLAERLGLISLERLDAVLWLRRPTGSDLVRVHGRYEAELTQACVVTLESLRVRLARRFSVVYDLAEAAGRETTAIEVAIEAAVEIDVEQEDPPEAVGPEGLDLGETVVQQLAVAIDPYPRAAGAELGRTKWSAGAEPKIQKASPFQALEALKDRK